MTDCGCTLAHQRKRIVLTGGPGAGKTAVLELVRQSLCRHVTVLPEAAGIVFGGGFPRRDTPGVKHAVQRAIYYVQRELEAAADAEGAGIVLCDRGCVDGAAYWIGSGDFWSAVGTTRQETLARYDTVVHLRVPNAENGYGKQNPLRVESVDQALAIDDRILQAWDGHPHRYIVEATTDFMAKARRAVEILRAELPECCRAHADWERLTKRAS
jgi:predicted ATPase